MTEETDTTLKELRATVERRRDELRTEMERGRQLHDRLVEQTARTRDEMLRIDGALRALDELLEKLELTEGP